MRREPNGIHPAEWVFTGMALMCLAWVFAAVVGAATRQPVPECGAPPAEIRPSTELRA